MVKLTTYVRHKERKIELKKRAVSPLIATVLLIGFTVAIGVFVYLWYGSFQKESLEKQGALSEIKNACATEVEIDVSNVDKSVSGELKLNVKNEKNNIIHGIRVRVNGDKGTELKTQKESFGPLEEKQIKIMYDTAKVGTLDYAEVMPLIVRQGVAGTCGEQVVKYNLKA